MALDPHIPSGPLADKWDTHRFDLKPVSYTHLRAHETRHDLVCRLLLEKKKTVNVKSV